MTDHNFKNDRKKVDTKELELPETVFIRDIENRVFQSIIFQCLSQIPGISLAEGNFIDNLLGRSAEGLKGIYAEQNEKNHSVNVRVEVNVFYGTPIPAKAEEIQALIAEEITALTGLHVGAVHVIFKNVIPAEQANKQIQQTPSRQNELESSEDDSNEF
jgi:uncharacterized alkaline shock family protein YloU